ncbi:ABC transporter ATP-binding protein, partial [Akkermansia sp.]|uniref:ABC transporter ATP-binding protein n=1 Tax=Akkermansia sp. TaxID=1872421 RepID=UPI003AF11BEF
VTVWATAAMLPMVVVVRGLSSFVNVYLLSKIGLGVLETLRLKVYRKYQDLYLAVHDRQQKGDLLSRLMQDTQFLQGGLVQIANDLIIQPLTLLAALGFLIYRASVSQQFLILLANMLLVGVCVIPIRYIGKKMLARARVVQSSQGDLSSTLQENFSSQRDIRAFELEEQQTSLFRNRIHRYIQASISAVRWQSLLTPLIEFVSAIAMAATLFVGNMNGMNMGDFAALATAMYLCYEPVKKLGAVHNKAETLNAGLERINHVLDAPDDVPEPENPKSPETWKGEVEFSNVCFGYQQDAPVMKNIDIRIPAGQVVALVGPSGAGKTTFINLLCRFYDVLSGSVKVDGIDVREMAKKDLLSHIALVSQYPVLFRGSVADNIRIGRPDASDAEVEEAGRMSAVDSFINETGEGYSRMIGEMGEGLSGGQRQRVSLARAFLKNAPILVLDEATASLDMKSEELIQKEIEKLASGRTAFIIAHRFSTIRMADRILVLEKGSVIADGTHEELMASSPLYRELYNKQQMVAEEEGGASC